MGRACTIVDGGVCLNDGVAFHCDGIARSNECKAGVAVSGYQPGYALPLHYGRRNTRVQAWQPLETAENDSGSLDGTENEPVCRETQVVRRAGQERVGERPQWGYLAVRRASKS